MSLNRQSRNCRSHGSVPKPDPELSPVTDTPSAMDSQPQNLPAEEESDNSGILKPQESTGTANEYAHTESASSDSVPPVPPVPTKRPVSRKKKSSRPKTPETPKPPDEEIDAALELLIHGVPPDDFDKVTLRYCVENLNQLKEDAIANGNYLEADEYAQLAKKASKAANSGSFSSVVSAKLAHYLEKQASAQETIDEINAQWDKIFQEFEDDVDAKMKEITDEQNRELDAFDQSVPDDLPPKYQKHSAEYVTLRAREKMLLKSQKFVMANAVKQKADKLEQTELADQHARLQDDLTRERNAIIEKHTKQYQAFAMWLNRRRNTMVRQRDKELEGPMTRLAHYTKLVEQIEKDGMEPNPAFGYSTQNVSRKETMRAVRVTAQTPLQRQRPTTPSLKKSSLYGYRPPSSIKPKDAARPSTSLKKKVAGKHRTPHLSSSSRASSKGAL